MDGWLGIMYRVRGLPFQTSLHRLWLYSWGIEPSLQIIVRAVSPFLFFRPAFLFRRHIRFSNALFLSFDLRLMAVRVWWAITATKSCHFFLSPPSSSFFSPADLMHLFSFRTVAQCKIRNLFHWFRLFPRLFSTLSPVGYAAGLINGRTGGSISY